MSRDQWLTGFSSISTASTGYLEWPSYSFSIFSHLILHFSPFISLFEESTYYGGKGSCHIIWGYKKATLLGIISLLPTQKLNKFQINQQQQEVEKKRRRHDAQEAAKQPKKSRKRLIGYKNGSVVFNQPPLTNYTVWNLINAHSNADCLMLIGSWKTNMH